MAYWDPTSYNYGLDSNDPYGTGNGINSPIYTNTGTAAPTAQQLFTPTVTGTPLGQDWIDNFNQTQTPVGPLPGGGTQVGYTPIPDTSGAPTGTWGGPVAPYSGGEPPTFTPPPLPDVLSRPYALPTAADLQSTPGYMARYQMGLDTLQKLAAARGTLLNGGTIKAATRYGQDYATGAYSDLVKQSLAARQQQASDYLNLAYGPAWQTNSAALNRYGTLYGQYQDLINNNRSAQNDYWQQQIDLAKLGLGATTAGSPGSTGANG